MGPRTGRGAGWCTGYAGREVNLHAAGPGFAPGFGRGRGFGYGGCLGGGRGRGGGWRWGGYGPPYADPGAFGPPDPEIEKQALAHQSQALQSELEWIRKRLSEIESEPTAQ
jgi:hypothetical protein